MAFADANRAAIRFIEETTWGVTPASGSAREMRLTSSSLAASKETVVSDELRADRMVSSVTEVSASSGGDINFEFSSGAQDEFLAAFLMGAWARPMSSDFVKGANISGRDLTGRFVTGRNILVKGFANAANNGYFTLSNVAFAGGNTTLTVSVSTLVVQAGTATTAIYDANDAIVVGNITISSTATGFSSTATPFTAAIAAGQLKTGQRIMVENLGAASGVYTILSAAGNLITTSPIPTAVVVAGSAVTIKANMLRNPSTVSSITQRMYTIETGFTDVGQYMVQTGMVPGSFTLEIAAGSIVNGTIAFQGRETVMQGTPLLGAAPYVQVTAQSGEVVNATTNIGSITKDGVAYSAAIQSLSLDMNTDLRQRSAIGSKFSRGIGQGRLNITGSLSAYFEDSALFNEFLTHDTVSLSFRIRDLDGYSYYITLPAVKFTQDEVSPGGIDQDIMDNVEFTAFRDANTECMVQIDRFSPTLV